MSGPSLDSLSEGQQIQGVYLLSRLNLPTTKNGKVFGALGLMDRSGEIDAKLWDQAEAMLGGLRPGQAVSIAGRVDSYQGALQLVLSAIDHAPDADPASFLPASPVPLGELKAGFQKALGRVQDPHLKGLLERIFVRDADFAARFESAPAAKSAHHAYVHGLLEHTLSVAELAHKMAGQYPRLSADLLSAGALLHDIGKADELTLGPPLGYTDSGRLEGHIVLGVRILDAHLAQMPSFPAELAMHLRHLILSHHGQYEFGSPKKPKTREALVLNLLDDMDAKLAMLDGIIDSGQGEGNWSKFNYLLERFIYQGPPPLEGGPAGQAPAQEPEPGGPGQSPAAPGLFAAPGAEGTKA